MQPQALAASLLSLSMMTFLLSRYLNSIVERRLKRYFRLFPLPIFIFLPARR